MCSSDGRSLSIFNQSEITTIKQTIPGRYILLVFSQLLSANGAQNVWGEKI